MSSCIITAEIMDAHSRIALTGRFP